MARRSKYTPDTVAKIVQAIELGATYELAAGYAGISYDTFRKWQNEKLAFYVAVKEAEGRASVKWLAKIEQAASDGAWQAAAWKLERRYPREYGRTVQEQHHSGSVDLRTYADQVAAELGLEPAEVMAQAERIIAEATA